MPDVISPCLPITGVANDEVAVMAERDQVLRVQLVSAGVYRVNVVNL
jgi:hypothetical protein